MAPAGAASLPWSFRIEGPHWGFASAPILGLAATVAVSSALFLYWEKGQAGALVPLDVFRKAAFSAALAVAGMMTFGMYAMLSSPRCICRSSAGFPPSRSGSSCCRCR